MSEPAFFHEKSFSLYLGKALLTFALIAPLSYCSIENRRTNMEAKSRDQQTLASLHQVCINQRGNWNSFLVECHFDD